MNINLPYCYGVVAWAMREQHCWIDNVVRPCSTISFSNDEATRLFMVVGNRGILYLIEQASYLGLFVWSYLGKARYFCNVFDARTLLPCSHFWFYKFTSENVRRIFNYTSKDQVLFFLKVAKLWTILSFRRIMKLEFIMFWLSPKWPAI